MSKFEMIVDEDLDQATIQDALRILNDLQTNLSTPYKQRKNIAPTPTEKQSRRMLKDIHVLEVQCLEVAAIAYHFGRKCNLYKEELDKFKSDFQQPLSDTSALASIESLLQGERESSQRVEAALGKVKEVLQKVKTTSEAKAEEVKRQLTQGFRDLERLLESSRQEGTAISIRDSLAADLNERDDRELTLTDCEPIEIVGERKRCVQRSAQTVESLTDKPVPARPEKTKISLDIESFGVSIKPRKVTFSQPRKALDFHQTLTLEVKPIAVKNALPFAAPLQVRPERKTDVVTKQVCNLLGRQWLLDLCSSDIAEIVPEEPNLELWKPPDIEVVSIPTGQIPAPRFSFSEEPDPLQRPMHLSMHPGPSLLVPPQEKPRPKVSAPQSLQVLPVANSVILAVSETHRTYIPPSEKNRRLEVCPLEPVVIRSWSLLEVFAFTEEPVKEDEAADPAAKKRSRRKVVRKDPIEEFFTLVCCTQTLQAAKLNQPTRESVPRIDGEALYRRAIQEGVPFNRWSEWLHQILRMSAQKSH